MHSGRSKIVNGLYYFEGTMTAFLRRALGRILNFAPCELWLPGQARYVLLILTCTLTFAEPTLPDIARGLNSERSTCLQLACGVMGYIVCSTWLCCWGRKSDACYANDSSLRQAPPNIRHCFTRMHLAIIKRKIVLLNGVYQKAGMAIIHTIVSSCKASCLQLWGSLSLRESNKS
jgi:hypothetical protein